MGGSWLPSPEEPRFAHHAGGRIALDEQPGTASADVLPVFQASVDLRDPLVGTLEGTGSVGNGQRLVEFELAQFARAAERTDQARHSRTGNGPWPGSSSTCPVAKRDRR